MIFMEEFSRDMGLKSLTVSGFSLFGNQGDVGVVNAFELMLVIVEVHTQFINIISYDMPGFLEEKTAKPIWTRCFVT